MAITGNKGEWSEIYALLKILGDTTVSSGDGDLNKIETLFYPIIKILRTENSCGYSYQIDDNNEIVVITGGNEQLRIPVSVFREQSISLLKHIQKATGSSFAIPETEEFMNSIYCHTLKAKSSDKTDIRIVIHDMRTGNTPLLGFSIKSKLGRPSTLLNPGRTTNFTYNITDVTLTPEQASKINAINTGSKILDRMAEIRALGGNLQFSDMESITFKNNLILIDSAMPKILAEMLMMHYYGITSNVKSMINHLQQTNPLGFDTQTNHTYYDYKIKKLLTDVALGMTPSKVWNGHYDANGGYLVVKEDGEVLCYHIYNKNDFENYLINNTRLDTASTSRYGFGTIVTSDNNATIKLNLQIRFI